MVHFMIYVLKANNKIRLILVGFLPLKRILVTCLLYCLMSWSASILFCCFFMQSMIMGSASLWPTPFRRWPVENKLSSPPAEPSPSSLISSVWSPGRSPSWTPPVGKCGWWCRPWEAHRQRSSRSPGSIKIVIVTSHLYHSQSTILGNLRPHFWTQMPSDNGQLFCVTLDQ